jgi:hypothetical protein
LHTNIASLEIFVAITSLVLGASHIFRASDWAAAYRRLHDLGRTGAFINGGLHLIVGAILISFLRSLAWPHAVLMVFGFLLVLKGTVCFLAPDLALRSMLRGGSRPRSFQFAGVLLLAISGWACYCAWHTYI